MLGSSGSRGFGELFGEAKGKLDDIQKDLGAILPSFPGMPVGKYGDLAIGVDVHSTIAPPTPSMPVPHVGAVFDIMGAIMAVVAEIPTTEVSKVDMPADGSEPPEPPMSIGDMACMLVKGMAPSVKVHGKWIANAGTGIQHIPGIIAHVAPVVSPMASSEMWMGSSTVLCDGSPFSTQAHPSLSCNIVGIPSVFRKGKAPKAKVSLMAPLAALTTIVSAGPPVLVGGPPIIDLFQLAMSMGLKGLGKLWKFGKGKIKKLKTKNAHLGKVKGKKKCTKVGEPVDVVTGRVLQSHLDFELAGPIPIVWRREYYSDVEIDGPIGSNWHHSYNIGIYDMKDSYTLRMTDGREVGLPKLDFGETYFHREEQLKWSLDKQGYLVEDADGYLYRFGVIKNKDGYEMLSQIATKDGFTVKFRYDGSGNLLQITDSCDRVIFIDTNSEGRIRSISISEDAERTDLIRYAYDDNGNLIKVTDARGISRSFEYEGHLLVKHIQQTGTCFYWQYEDKKNKPRCVRTWGDGDVLDYRFKFGDGVNHITDSLGNVTDYYYDSRDLIYKVVDANGGVTHQIYNEYEELEIVVNPEGLSTKSAFNDKGFLIKNTNENEESTHYRYDDRGNLISVVSPSGVCLSWDYDEFDRIVKRRTASGEELTYIYEDKLLTQIVDGNDKSFSFEYNKRFELTHLLYPNGLSHEWEYNERGNLIREKDVKGNLSLFKYNKEGNLVWMQEPDGNVHEFEYDGFFNLTKAKDKLHEVSFTYGAMGVLRSRTQNGRSLSFDYDRELQLRRITNEGGEQYHFELDGLGQVTKETGFDNLKREYIRDGVGRVIEVIRPNSRWTKYKYDGTGNVIKEEHHDESWTGYKYNSEGLLVEAINEEGNIKFTRDRLGRIIKEEYAGNSVSRTYNEKGDCIHISSSLGADIHQEYDEEGNLMSLKSAKTWQVDWQYDATGLELYRQMTGGVNIRTQRDHLGRETRKTVSIEHHKHSQKQYNWGIGNRLQNIQNELKSTSVNFEYDVFDNLIRADYQDTKELQTIYRTPDAIGNYYETPTRSDRKYGKSGKLLEDPTYYYHYDTEGNLIFKEFKKHQGFHSQGRESLEKKLKIKFKGTATGWQYEWSANGMLKQVTNPEHGKTRFGYDPLCRRVFKETKKKRTNWLWDENAPLHEWESHSTESLINVVTWIFEGGFVPCAKVTQDKSYSIVTDYLGTPTQMFDNEGSNIWDMELDIYGKVRTFKGSSLSDCPFRYQGQYLDQETGLYYNRFRYYDPDMGNYISQDPIGLEGDNPTLYGYVNDPNVWVDNYGLSLFNPIVWTAPSRGTGNNYKVYQQDIDWDRVDPKTGKTNLELASKGRAPIGADGRPINLHHSKQNAKGPLFEISGSVHSKYGHTNALHPYRVTPNPDGSKNHPFDPVDRKKFDKDRKKYWKDRAKSEKQRRKSLSVCSS